MPRTALTSSLETSSLFQLTPKDFQKLSASELTLTFDEEVEDLKQISIEDGSPHSSDEEGIDDLFEKERTEFLNEMNQS
jgi:hypothetical protein